MAKAAARQHFMVRRILQVYENGQFTYIFVHTVYSVRKDLTGLANAAFIAWKLTVSEAINKALIAATGNTHH
jgi:hypothetical protein